MIYNNYASELLSLYDFKLTRSLTEMLCKHFKGNVVYNEEVYTLISDMLSTYESNYIFAEDVNEKSKVNLIGVSTKFSDEDDLDGFLSILTDILLSDLDIISHIEWVKGYDECLIHLN